MIMAVAHTASERRHARSAINTIQAVRRSLVDEVCASGKHLGEMRRTVLYDREEAMSHISEMLLERCVPSVITLCIVLLAPAGVSHASGMARLITPSERGHARSVTTLRMVLIAPIGASHVSDMMCLSVLEEILLLDFHAVLSQKLTVFLGKRLTAMVFLLLGDIAHYHVFVAQTIRKARILLRPSVEKREMRVGFQPLAGGDFDFLNKLGHRQSRWQGHKKMHMIRHTADTVKTASDIVDKTVHVGIEFSLMLLINGGDASIGTEDNMIIRLRVTHAILTMNNTDYCNTTPRRGDMHKVQLTPYKPIGAVWWPYKRSTTW